MAIIRPSDQLIVPIFNLREIRHSRWRRQRHTIRLYRTVDVGSDGRSTRRAQLLKGIHHVSTTMSGLIFVKDSHQRALPWSH